MTTQNSEHRFNQAQDEESPLLRNGGDTAVATNQHGDDCSVTSTVEETSNEKLALIQGSIWIGVFLAALGWGITPPGFF
jgi:hypothetical protein